MKKGKFVQGVGWLLFLFALGLFFLQMGYFFLHGRFQVEYIDNRLFYIINMVSVICLLFAIIILLTLTKKWVWIGAGIVIVFIVVNAVLLVSSNQEVKNITSISPNLKHVLSIKENQGEAIYYRPYFSIFGRPKETLPYPTKGDFQVEWLTDDIAAVTYKATDETIHQFIGTYGDRGGGISYYYVGAEIHGEWQANNFEVISNTEGITVIENGKTELFDWDHIVQFGTLAVVLIRDNKAVWTIALGENFEVHSDASIPTTGEIILYKATMEDNRPITLQYE